MHMMNKINEYALDINHLKMKNIARPTDPIYFLFVTGNSGVFYLAFSSALFQSSYQVSTIMSADTILTLSFTAFKMQTT